MESIKILTVKELNSALNKDWKDEVDFLNYYESTKSMIKTFITTNSLEYRAFLEMRATAILSLKDKGMDVSKYMEPEDYE